MITPDLLQGEFSLTVYSRGFSTDHRRMDTTSFAMEVEIGGQSVREWMFPELAIIRAFGMIYAGYVADWAGSKNPYVLGRGESLGPKSAEEMTPEALEAWALRHASDEEGIRDQLTPLVRIGLIRCMEIGSDGKVVL